MESRVEISDEKLLTVRDVIRYLRIFPEDTKVTLVGIMDDGPLTVGDTIYHDKLSREISIKADSISI